MDGWHKVLARDASGVFVYTAKCVQCNSVEDLRVLTWQMDRKPPHLLTNVSVMCQPCAAKLMRGIVRPPRGPELTKSTTETKAV